MYSTVFIIIYQAPELGFEPKFGKPREKTDG